MRRRGIVARAGTPRYRSIQSSLEANGPTSNRSSAPSTSTKKVVAASMSGTVNPMCSAPNRPGSPLFVIGAVHRHVLEIDLLLQKVHSSVEERL